MFWFLGRLVHWRYAGQAEDERQAAMKSKGSVQPSPPPLSHSNTGVIGPIKLVRFSEEAEATLSPIVCLQLLDHHRDFLPLIAHCVTVGAFDERVPARIERCSRCGRYISVHKAYDFVVFLRQSGNEYALWSWSRPWRFFGH